MILCVNPQNMNLTSTTCCQAVVILGETAPTRKETSGNHMCFIHRRETRPK